MNKKTLSKLGKLEEQILKIVCETFKFPTVCCGFHLKRICHQFGMLSSMVKCRKKAKLSTDNRSN